MQRTSLALLFTALVWVWSKDARAAPSDGARSDPHASRPRAVVSGGVAAAFYGLNSDDAYGLAYPVHAGVAVPAPTSAADAATLDARIGELERALADVQRPTRMYFAGWLSAMSVMAVSQGTIGLFVDDPALRESMPSAIGTLAISELQVWTRSKAAIDHWERYRTGVPSLALALAPEMLGVSLHASLSY